MHARGRHPRRRQPRDVLRLGQRGVGEDALDGLGQRGRRLVPQDGGEPQRSEASSPLSAGPIFDGNAFASAGDSAGDANATQASKASDMRRSYATRAARVYSHYFSTTTMCRLPAAPTGISST